SRVGIFAWGCCDATGDFFFRTHACRTGDVDVDVLVVIRVLQDRVRVRTTAGLDVGDINRVADVADVEDPDPAESIVADRLLDTLRAAVEPSAQTFTRHEHQILVDRDVALRSRANILGHNGWSRRV